MKTINVTFEDEEMEELERVKKDLSWREFILTLIRSKKEADENGFKNKNII